VARRPGAIAGARARDRGRSGALPLSGRAGRRARLEGRQNPATGSYWLVDPLDGTKGYLRGGQYSVAVALVENERPVLGILGCPALGLASPASESPIDCLDARGSLYAAWSAAG